MPLRFVVLHLGAQGQPFNPVAFDHAYRAIATIQSFAGVRILLETLANDIATFERIRQFTDAAQIRDVGICYDTGHGEWEHRPDAIHLNDNNRDEDEHLWPFEGKRNWPALVEQIVLSEFDGPMILEGRDEEFGKAHDGESRLKDLIDEARSSIDEFRLKYRLPAPRQKDEE
jgi:sugar phosphate isomerase/epimerase